MGANLLKNRGLDVNLRSGPQMREYAAIVARIARDRPRRILDWGCGWGQISHMLKREGLDVAAMDYDAERAAPEVVRLERFPDVEAVLTPDPVELPFADAEFDAVLSLGVLEHVCHPRESLREIRRVLQPGGTLYVYKLPNRFSYLERLAKRLGIYYHGELRAMRSTPGAPRSSSCAARGSRCARRGARTCCH